LLDVLRRQLQRHTGWWIRRNTPGRQLPTRRQLQLP
jgi:hypothetical protein